MLPPDQATLDRLMPLLEGPVQHFAVTPETLWRPTAAGALAPNDYHRCFLELGARTGRPFIAHGVALSPAGVGGERRRRSWHQRIAADHARFRFRWYTEHAGTTTAADETLALPLPVPMTATAAARTRARLRRLQRLVPDVGLENTAHHFVPGDPLDEPAFLARCLAGPRLHLLLDLHNVHTMARNLGFDPRAYLAALPLERVIEIHVSGGTTSRPGWLPSGRRYRLDSHDAPVPEPVWRLLAHVRRRCPNLQALTLERMEGTVAGTDVPLLREELRRLEAAA
jgi:hypothetical protein